MKIIILSALTILAILEVWMVVDDIKRECAKKKDIINEIKKRKRTINL